VGQQPPFAQKDELLTELVVFSFALRLTPAIPVDPVPE